MTRSENNQAALENYRVTDSTEHRLRTNTYHSINDENAYAEPDETQPRTSQHQMNPQVLQDRPDSSAHTYAYVETHGLQTPAHPSSPPQEDTRIRQTSPGSSDSSPDSTNKEGSRNPQPKEQNPKHNSTHSYAYVETPVGVQPPTHSSSPSDDETRLPQTSVSHTSSPSSQNPPLRGEDPQPKIKHTYMCAKTPGGVQLSDQSLPSQKSVTLPSSSSGILESASSSPENIERSPPLQKHPENSTHTYTYVKTPEELQPPIRPSDGSKIPQTSDGTHSSVPSSPDGNQEGWVDNTIYTSSNEEEDVREGWKKNSIYVSDGPDDQKPSVVAASDEKGPVATSPVTTDAGDSVEGCKKNSVYVSDGPDCQ